MTNIEERAIKICEEEIGDEICNKIGLRGTLKILRAIEKLIDQNEGPHDEMFMTDNPGPVKPMKIENFSDSWNA